MKWLKEYFNTTSSERNGAIVLLSIIVCFGLYYLFSFNNEPLIQVIENNTIESITPDDSLIEKGHINQYVKFDPNELDIDGWVSMGFSTKQAGSILKYRYSLGGFKYPEELLNCYVIDSLKYIELLPYIKFFKYDNEKNKEHDDIHKQTKCNAVFLVSGQDPIYDRFDQFQSLYYIRSNEKYHYYTALSDDSVVLHNYLDKALKSGFSNARIDQVICQNLKNITPKKLLLDINIADSLSLRSLKGIGPILSKRIVEYRIKLGGFIYKEQLNEVYGIQLETYNLIKNRIQILDSSIKQLNINTCSIEDLKSHPYINWNIANSIVNFRQQHGWYTSIDKIKSIHLVVDEIYRKIAPYLRID